MTTISPEDQWTDEELVDVRSRLDGMAHSLRTELSSVDRDMAAALLDRCHDDIDWADKQAGLIDDTFRAEKLRAVLDQTVRVIDRLDAGLYGICEQCNGPITKERMQAFPRATCCMTCLS